MKIISHARKNAVIFKILMETGLMPHELANVKPKDIDLEHRVLNAYGFKGHTSRSFKLTYQTTAMLREYLAKYKDFQMPFG